MPTPVWSPDELCADEEELEGDIDF